jgi:hypothetical protein
MQMQHPIRFQTNPQTSNCQIFVTARAWVIGGVGLPQKNRYRSFADWKQLPNLQR